MTIEDSDVAGTIRYVGTRIPRVEDPRLLTGHGTFVDDVKRPGMLHACFVRSPFARARILSIDTLAARSTPGVHAVLVAEDLNPDVVELWFTGQGRHGPTTPLPPLAEAEVRFVGDPVALVIADDRYLAEDAADLVTVEYEPLNAVVDYEAATTCDELVHAAFPANVVGELGGGSEGLVADAFGTAPHVVRETIRQQSSAAVPMETRGIVVEWSAAAQELTIWIASQAPHEVRSVCSRVLGLAEQHIRVIIRDTGGAFGQKVLPQREEITIMLAARRFRRAIKWIEDRRENLLAAGQARHELADVQMAFAEDGTMLAARIDHVEDVGAYPVPWPVGTGMAVALMFPGPYRIPTVAFTHRSVFSNTVGRTAYRGPWMFESVAREVLLDIAARRLGLDPVELRRRNILRAAELPYTNGCGMPYAHMSPAETFEHAVELLGYDDFRASRRRPVGPAVSSESARAATSSRRRRASASTTSEGATIRIEPSGKVNVYVAGGSAGNSLETTVVQLTADALGVSIDDVSTIQGDTALTPYGAGTGGSRSGSMLAGAISATASVLRDKLVRIAAHWLEAAPDDIEIVGGAHMVRGAPAMGVSVADLADRAYFNAYTLPPGMTAGLEASERFTVSPMPNWANATHVCTCEVDITTGGVRLLRYIVAEDCGPMINPAVVEGQIAGGTVQGIGGALFEELAYDEAGNPLATTFMDYLLPTAADVPEIEYGHVVTPGAGPGGYKGVGEGGAIGAPPAVANAVADALAPLGVTITRLPLSPAAIVALIDEARSR